MVEFAMHNAWLIPLLPAISFAVIALLLWPWPKASSTFSILMILTSFVLAVAVVYGVYTQPELIEKSMVYSTRWFSMPGLRIDVGIMLDPTSAMMLWVVTLVASLVQIYSLGYMEGDPGFSSFYAYLSLFAASMLGLVLSSNLLQMFVFWELVGLCSYLLIGFWFYKDSAREAAKKAFITTRVGDFGLLIGLLSLQLIFGTLNIPELAEKAVNFQNYVSAGTLTLVLVVLFLGPIGKSGQFPLHVWLPDAMEGPTPVSALIHAATMVVAGVYLVGRILFLFKAVPTAMHVVAIIGGFTAFFAATIALTQTEMKRILAYSTISQLGYMMLALGAASLTASMFHLMTHAYFKALMFLGAGSVLHALHGKAHIHEMGGLYKKMPWTTWTFVIGALAIAGIPPLAGFWSKDEILLVVKEAAHEAPGIYTPLFWLALVTAFLTAFYMFRQVFTAFFGPEKPENHPHEAPWNMRLPLLILAFFSIVGGWVGLPWLEKGFGYWVRMGEFHHAEPDYVLMGVSVLVALAGIYLAYLMYLKKAIDPDKVAEKFGVLYKLSYNKYYIDEIYLWFNQMVVDGMGKILYWFDLYIVDGIVNGIGAITRGSGAVLRYTTTGNLQTYALVIFMVIVVITLYFAFGDASFASLFLGGGK
ncbi:NADH-quinone oxidoreductase subunit L [Carboxydothermus hydrogenoformans]|uniref:Proton-translocating NADH-quinone oxidoreductase, L subunit n=1 Tax=Carboxydothermus hydrogenoformans (strain ATCC BAA-161 / DSM 6008 / Z-2901) TaxID=246194 RepID=Q3AC85_CARHZ|nr:NADH-quinone oxidoreductase subunit L [Carboxydothermus hydrogenoformans]ABB15054.1 proton-translocating NADH-quinone oxidoreductase, L subunit [Carboxydothermus hydrogenoformans Z-2901]